MASCYLPSRHARRSRDETENGQRTRGTVRLLKARASREQERREGASQATKKSVCERDTQAERERGGTIGRGESATGGRGRCGARNIKT